MSSEPGTVSRRDVLSLIGAVSGSAAMYHAMTSLGFAADSGYKGPIKLDGDPKGASVLILGAGLAGMTAALELRKAGYNVQILEFSRRAGGRNWTLRGGDSFTELGGFKQTCEFEQGLYINPGPWRIPYHHRAILDYCKRLGVPLEPFIQLNHNALLHATKAFGGVPQRIRDIKTDFQGQISELLAKANGIRESLQTLQLIGSPEFTRLEAIFNNEVIVLPFNPFGNRLKAETSAASAMAAGVCGLSTNRREPYGVTAGAWPVVPRRTNSVGSSTWRGSGLLCSSRRSSSSPAAVRPISAWSHRIVLMGGE